MRTRRRYGHLGIAAVIAAAAGLSAVLPWHPAYAGLALAIVAALVAVSVVGAPTALRPGREAGPDGLRGLRGWHIVDAVDLDGAVIDHVIVAPAAVLAVVAEPDTTTVHDLAAAKQAAQRVRQFVRQTGADDIAVVPMIWTRAPGGQHCIVDGVHLVDGTDPAPWLHLFRDVRFGPQPRLEVCAALEARAAEHRLVRVSQGHVPATHGQLVEG